MIATSSQHIVQKLWSYCNLHRDVSSDTAFNNDLQTYRDKMLLVNSHLSEACEEHPEEESE